MNTQRQELIFAVIAAIFLGSLTMMNILGIARFVDLSFTCVGVHFTCLVPIGVLPYPITFLCTDLVSELYGKKRANLLVFAGLIANLWILAVMWLTGLLPNVPSMDPATALPASNHPEYAYYQIRLYALGGIVASMAAYVIAQFLDVYLFHYWRKLTQGKHLWLRNNGSTLVSQAVDTVVVLSVSMILVGSFPVGEGQTFSSLSQLVLSAYLFKMVAALLDTIPLYILVRLLKQPSKSFAEYTPA